jgi:3-hydroxyacyl-CoA dehydrogenase/enoyl-CoA hydratase/3-hydroxybutyryl-CoA epimerase
MTDPNVTSTESTGTPSRAGVRLEVTDDSLGWIIFDNHESRPNILTRAVMQRFSELLEDVSSAVATGGIRALIIRSGKDGSFIAGADITEFAGIETAAAGEAGAREGQQLFVRVDRMPIPVLCAIDGICLGGGTELALACDYRIASDRPETKIGLPEVRLGILPGFGGTTRLPRLIGTKAALDLILTGSNADARKAQRIGLIDERVHPSILYDRARSAALEMAQGRRQPLKSKALMDRFLDDTGPGRKLLMSQARKKVEKETRGNYPAPLAILDLIDETHGMSVEDSLAREAAALGRLIVTPVSRNLVHVFGLMEAAKKAGPRGITSRPVERAAVVGAGVMGGGIAQLFATRGIAVRMKDINTEALGNGLRHAQELYDKQVKRRRLSRREAKQQMDLIAPTLDYNGFTLVDVVVEAVVERMNVKKQVLREVESACGDATIIATNTSSLSVSEMQAVLERPANFCGMHFFNPVHRMPLVEVIRGDASSDLAIATIFDLARRLDKIPVIVKDGPGFLVNRVLAPYLNEAGWMLSEGVSIEDIDKALLEFGMPMGPLRLLDEVGLDVAGHAGASMAEAFGERLAAPPTITSLQTSKLLGRKGGRGFYVYHDDDEPSVNKDIYALIGAGQGERGDGVERGERGERAMSSAEIQERAVFAMINEAARVLEDGIVAGPGDVDIGMITGTGFPPFRGGLLRYADTLGITNVLKTMEKLSSKYGVRFDPAPLIRERAAAGRGFYD